MHKHSRPDRGFVIVLFLMLSSSLLLSSCGAKRYTSPHQKEGMALLAKQQPEEAAARFKEGLADAKMRGDAPGTVQMLSLLGWASAESLRFDEAERYFLDAVSLAGENGIEPSVLLARLAVVRCKPGNFGPGVETAGKALALTAARWSKKAGGGSEKEIIDYAIQNHGFPPDEEMIRAVIMSEAAFSVLYLTSGDMKKAAEWGARTVRHAGELSFIMKMAPAEDRFTFYQGTGVAAGAASQAYAALGDPQKEKFYLSTGRKAFKAIDVTVKNDDLLAAYLSSGGYDDRKHRGQSQDLRFSTAYNEADSLYAGGMLSEAEAAFRKVIESARHEGNRTEEARTLSQLGWLLAERGRYAEATRLIEKSIATAPGEDEKVMSRTRLAAVLSRLGNFEKSLKLADEALDIAVRNRPALFNDRNQEAVIDSFVKNPGLPPDVVMLKAVLGSEAAKTVSYYFVGDYARAVQYGEQAVGHFLDAEKAVSLAAVRERKDFYDGVGYSAMCTGDSLTFLDQYEKGREYFIHAESFFEKSGSVFGRYASRALFACSYLREGRYRESAEEMRKIWEDIERLGLEDILWRSKSRFAYYFDLHAQRYFERIKQMESTSEKAEIVKEEILAGAREQLSSISLLLGERAAADIQSLLAALEAAKDRKAIAGAGGKLIRRLKEIAYQNFIEAIERIESIRSNLETDLNKRAFRADKQILYDGFVRLSVELYGPEAGLEAVERAKARDLLDLLAGKEIAFKHGMLSDREKRSRKQAAARVGAITGRHREKIDVSAINEAVDQYRAIVVEIRRKEPELASLITTEYHAFKEIVGLLSGEATLLEYYETPDALYAFVVTGGQASVEIVPVSRKALKTKVEDFRRAILAQNRPEEKSLSRELYGLLIKPVENRLRGERLVIIPDSSLHYLPFTALHGKDSYLAERFSLAFSPSAGILKYARIKSSRKTLRALAFGNPDLGDPAMDLPNAQVEAAEVAALYPGSSFYSRSEATETLAKSLSGHFGILHFATHGEFSSTDPLYSGIRLARDPKNDGRLEAAEIFSMDISPSLVTLSACQTGLGLVTEGGEIIGMNRTFIYAGAPAVLSSLWNVSDASTAMLMGGLYRNMKTLPKDKALQTAQKALIRSKRYNAPFYWAAFYLTGDWR